MDKLERLSDESLEYLIQFGEKWLDKGLGDLIYFLRSMPDKKVWNKKVEATFLATGPHDSNAARLDAYDAAIRQVDEEYLARFNTDLEAMKNEKARRAAVFDSIKPVCPRSSYQDDDDDDDDSVVN